MTESQPCAWCGCGSVGTIEVEPRYPGTRAKHYRDTRPAITVPVCAGCRGSLEMRPAGQPSKKAIKEKLETLSY